MSFLKEILPAKEAEVRQLKARFAASPAQRPDGAPIRDFKAALTGGDRVIAEIKGKSPSHPEFQQFASPATLARAYRRNGAAAISIVTDTTHFGTSLADVAAVREAVDLPVLVKDFVIDEVQLRAAWAAGADVALLIVRMLNGPRLAALLGYARELGLQILVECHDEQDVALAHAAQARFIGVNNRNLATLTTDLDHGEALLPSVPADVIRISESGLYQRRDIERMAAAGADAFLVGHALLQSGDPGRKVAELCGRETEGARRVKVCGLTEPADAIAAHDAGAHFLGMVFAPGSRQVSRQQAAAIRAAVPDGRLCGVFVDAPLDEIVGTCEACDLDLIQLHGQESPADCALVAAACGRPLIKALTPDQATTEAAASFSSVAYFLVDLPKGPDKRGLTTADCAAAARNLADAGHDVFLAGGLTPGNVGDLPRVFAVDVASGVESTVGLKDIPKIVSFIAEATR